MAGLRELKNRIKSTGNIKQMTKAMEAVSAVKMRRSVALALESRPYALTALRVLEKMRRHLEPHETLHSPLFDKNGVSKKTLVVIASDKGLVGSFNTTVLRKAANTAKAPGEFGRIVYRRGRFRRGRGVVAYLQVFNEEIFGQSDGCG